MNRIESINQRTTPSDPMQRIASALPTEEVLAPARPALARLALSAALGLVCASLANASTWYVRADAAPGGDGTSWATAFNKLQAGIAAASPSDQVWVKAGTYLPGTAASARTVTFTPKNGVAIYGGFAGTETLLAQRDWIANPTVLSGDLLLDDGPNFTNRGDNVYHVVTAYAVNASAVLDGFVVRGGNANGLGNGHTYGGGILGTNATLRNLKVTDNEAGAGGGIAMAGGAWIPTTIVGCVLRNNRAVAGGGGLYCSIPSFVFRDCVFAGNSANFGGGAHIELESQGPGSFVDCIFAGNVGNQGTGGLSSAWCMLNTTNCVIAYNHSNNSTGGMSGGGQPSADVTLANSIAWGNTSNGPLTLALEQTSPWVLLANSAVQGSNTPFSADPRWTNALGADGIAGTEDDDFTLSCLSPYIDRGLNANAAGIALDLAGHPRFADDPATVDLGTGTAPIVDLGPYEFVCACDHIETYCTALPNTSGGAASIGASGSTSLHANSLVLHVTGGPPLKNGIFFYGALQTSAPWGAGIHCVAGTLFRLPALTLDASGAASLAFDATHPPASSGPGQVLAGSTWNFQFYFRDPVVGSPSTNASDALLITFCR